MNTMATLPSVDNLEELNQWFDDRFQQKINEWDTSKTTAMTIIATKGTMDMAYPPFILASTAAALGWDVSIFFTFYGLSLLKKELDLKVTPMGNPAMPMKLPFGPQWLQQMELPMPTLAMSMPGFEGVATKLMRQSASNKGVASINELREISIEAGVRLVACQMTVDWFGWKQEDFIDGIDEWVGAASFLPRAQKAQVNLFV